MLYNDAPRRNPYMPIWSELLGRFCGNVTLCTACHPDTCVRVDCCGFTANDVAECHVGQSCDRCGEVLPGAARQEA